MFFLKILRAVHLSEHDQEKQAIYAENHRVWHELNVFLLLTSTTQKNVSTLISNCIALWVNVETRLLDFSAPSQAAAVNWNKSDFQKGCHCSLLHNTWMSCRWQQMLVLRSGQVDFCGGGVRLLLGQVTSSRPSYGSSVCLYWRFLLLKGAFASILLPCMCSGPEPKWRCAIIISTIFIKLSNKYKR